MISDIENPMKVFMVGGTGLLGSEGAKQLLAKGHEVTSLSRSVKQEENPTEEPNSSVEEQDKLSLRYVEGDYLTASEEQIREWLEGNDAFVFAAGLDERVEIPPPAYETFCAYNVEPLERFLQAAKEVGVKRAVVLGSYFTYFERIWPERELAKWHPYIRSRKAQLDVALSYVDDDFFVAVLELPYIFGTQKGRRPVWVFLVEMVQKMKPFTFYPGGGTTMVTIRQVGEAIAGAVEKNVGGKAYPLGWHNMSWRELMHQVNAVLGEPNKKVITIPCWLFGAAGKRMEKNHVERGVEGGLNLYEFRKVMCDHTYIDKTEGALQLGVTDDDIEEAIRDSVVQSLDVLEGRFEERESKGPFTPASFV